MARHFGATETLSEFAETGAAIHVVQGVGQTDGHADGHVLRRGIQGGPYYAMRLPAPAARRPSGKPSRYAIRSVGGHQPNGSQ